MIKRATVSMSPQVHATATRKRKLLGMDFSSYVELALQIANHMTKRELLAQRKGALVDSIYGR